MKLADEIAGLHAPMNALRDARAGRMSRHQSTFFDDDMLVASRDVIPFCRVREQMKEARYYAWSPSDTAALLTSLEHAQRKLRNIKRLLGESDEPTGPRAA